MSFWKNNNNNKVINSEEYEKLFKRITELNNKVEEIIGKIAIINTNYDNLRGNFNRKLSGTKEKEEIKEETAKDIKQNVFLSPNGAAL